jgi:PAS domain S-box-containing protein
VSDATTVLDAVLESSPDAVITMDDEGRVLALNSAAERMFRMSAADARGRLAAHAFVAPRLREAHARRLRGLRDGGDGDASGFARTRLQSQALRGDGSQFPVEVTLSRTSESPARVVA